MKTRLARALRVLLHVEGSPHRTALAFGIGVFIAFFPVLGIHTGLALLVAFGFRLSRAAILIGAYVNNPWTIAPLYLGGTLLGCGLLSVPPEGLARLDWGLEGRAFYGTLAETLRPYLWPFVVGNLVAGFLGGALGYMALRAWLERRHRQGAEAG